MPFKSFLLLLSLSLTCPAQEGFIWQGLDETSWSVLQQFFEYDRYRELDARILNKEDHVAYYRRELVVFTGDDGLRVPAWIAIPKVRQPPYPLVILHHDLAGSKEDFWQPDGYWGFDLTKKLLAAGFAVMTPDARHHGSRIAHNDFEALDQTAMKKGHFSQYRSLLIGSVIDTRRALDYARTRDDINMSKVGIFGYGSGGIVAVMAGVVERRIKMGVTCVPPIFKEQTAVHGLHNYASRLGEKPYLLLMAEDDEGYTYNEAKRFHSMIPSTQKDLVFYDSDHRLPKPYTARATRYFRAHLGKWDAETVEAPPGQ